MYKLCIGNMYFDKTVTDNKTYVPEDFKELCKM